MRKLVTAFIVCLVATVSQAQDHLRFMDIPLDGTLETFCNKLISEKGLVPSQMTKGEEYTDYETKKLTGTFFNIGTCTFYVRKHNRLDNVSFVIVEDTLSALSEEESNKLVAKLDGYYGQHDTDSLYSKWYLWKTSNGNVEFNLRRDGFSLYFYDYTEVELKKLLVEEFQKEWERQTVKEICGIPFGSSYEKTKEVLENKYGSSSIYSDKTKIVYSNKTYAGITFDNIYFLFQSDGYKSYFHGCIFIIEAKSLLSR